MSCGVSTRTGSSAKALVWGLFLIAIGGAFLLDRFGLVDLPAIGTLWPLVFVVIAVSNLLEGRPGSAITFLIVAGWFFAVEFDWMGLTYRNSWPVALVAVGAGIVIGALSGEDERRRRRVRDRIEEVRRD